MTPIEAKLFEGGKAVAVAEGLTIDQYSEAFHNWIDAVIGCGVKLESSIEFHKLLDTAIKDYKEFVL